MDKRRLRTALGRYTTGVTIVSCFDAAGARVGLTVNSFASLSLEPPLVMWALRRESPCLGSFEAAGCFAVNVLTEAQIGLSRRFSSIQEHRFTDSEWLTGAHGAPVLKDAAAVFECRTHAKHEGGDHRLFIGEVLAYIDSPCAPLVYRSAHYHRLGDVI